jgi:hypothetical protein
VRLSGIAAAFVFILTAVLGADSAASQYVTVVGGAAGTEFGDDVIETSDGGIIVAGYTSSYGAGNTDWLISKFSQTGGHQWTKTVGLGSGSVDWLGAAINTSDGGYAVAGVLGNAFAIYKFDALDVIQWCRSVDVLSRISDMIQTSDGGYLTVGEKDYAVGDRDILISKFSPAGIHTWSRAFGGDSIEQVSAVVQDEDDNYIVVGTTESWAYGWEDAYMAKFNSSGTLQWMKVIGGTQHDYGYSVVATSDGGYVMVGSTDSYGTSGDNIMLIKLNAAGGQVFARTIGTTNYDYGRRVIKTSDGGYAITGQTGYPGDNYGDAILLKFDDLWNPEWYWSFGSNVGSEYGWDVIQTADKGYAVVGFTTSYESPSISLMLARFDSLGTTCLGGNISMPINMAYFTQQFVEPDVITVSPSWSTDCLPIVTQTPVIIPICGVFVCGDANNDGVVNILDIAFLINYLYKGGPAPAYPVAADVNNDDVINILDITYLISYLYKDGPDPICG